MASWTVAHLAPLSMVFSRQGYWGGCHFLQGIFLLQGIFPTLGSNPSLLCVCIHTHTHIHFIPSTSLNSVSSHSTQITCVSFLQPWLYRSPSASFQSVFSENCFACRYVFRFSWGKVSSVSLCSWSLSQTQFQTILINSFLLCFFGCAVQPVGS